MILKHRDTELLRFEWLEPQGVRVLTVNEAGKKFLPLDMHGEPTDAAQIAEALGYAHVSYGLEKFKNRLCSTCPLFTGEKVGFIAAGRLVSETEALNDPRFAEIFFFDAIICNTDRHLGNFGYLIDNDKNEVIGAAPIFDNGCGLFSRAFDRPQDRRNHEWGDLRKHASKIGPSLYMPWLAFPGGITTAMKAAAMKLRGFRFKRHPEYNLPPQRLEALERFIQDRVDKIIEYGAKADNFLLISRRNEAEPSVGCGEHEADIVSRRIIDQIQADPYISQLELSQIIGVSRSTVQRQIAKLKKSGRLTLAGTGRIKSWKVVNGK